MDIFESKEFLEIPEQFYSTDTSKPFNNCINCDTDLFKSGTLYIVEKAIRQYPKFNTDQDKLILQIKF